MRNGGPMNKLTSQLQHLLADSYILMLKTHNYHWNVQGRNFQQLHILFEGQYTDLFAAVDLIAERIRALDSIVEGQYSNFIKKSKIKESTEKKSKNMIKDLIASNLMVVQTAKSLVKIAQQHEDDASADLAIERINIHEKSIWMLKSMIAED